jgi:mutator protein MutT
MAPTKTSSWAVIRNNRGEYLLLRRSSKVNKPGLWNFPGGNVDDGEEPIDAVVREAREEIGVSLSKVRSLGIKTNPINGKVSSFFSAKLSNTNKIKINSESSSFGWFTKKKALQLDLHPPTEMYLNHELKFRTKMIHSSLFKQITGELENGEIVASACVCLATGLLHDVKVEKEYRGFGYAHDLMNFVMSMDSPPVKLTVKPTHGSPVTIAHLVDFYSEYGFKPESSSPFSVKMRT